MAKEVRTDSVAVPNRIELWTTDDRSYAVFVVPAPPDLSNLPLTSAEREVVILALGGGSDIEIAAHRGCAPRTVANQLRSVFQKLRVNSRVELAALIMALVGDDTIPDESNLQSPPSRGG